MVSLRERFLKVQQEIEKACKRSGRDLRELTLVAVSKSQPVEVLKEAVSLGIKVFGENRVQEAERKIELLGHNVEWHLIGHLQSNKARKAVRLFDAIHSVDSVKIAGVLERICFDENRQSLPVFVQVNLSGEKTKSGVPEKDLPILIDFLKSCARLQLIGFMTLPPFFDDVERVRPFFKKLRLIRDELLPNGYLSMGMSHDFSVAIEEGATHLRIGTAIFGERLF